MESLTVVLAVLVLGGGLTWMQYRRSNGRIWSPLWTAFSLTAAALLLLAAGFAGYELQGGIPFSRAAAWTGTVVWWQVAAGSALVIVATPLWLVGLRRIERATRRLRA
jgi:hypothetical protein